LLVAIDIGGTFTDLMAFDEATGRFAQAKASPRQPSSSGDHRLSAHERSRCRRVRELIHGSTTAINTLIERKGAKTGLIVTRGTRDVYSIGRGNRPESYNLFSRHRPLVPRHLTGRSMSDARLGRVLEPLARASLEEACAAWPTKKWKRLPLFSALLRQPEHERAAGEIVRRALPAPTFRFPTKYLREYREFERTSTTVVNAYIGPKVGGYVRSLKASLANRFSRRSDDHAVERRRDDARGRHRASVAMMESGRSVGSSPPRRRTRAGLRQRDLLRHGRHHRQGELDTRRRAHDGPGYTSAIRVSSSPCGGAAHVEGDHVGEAQRASRLRGGDDPTDARIPSSPPDARGDLGVITPPFDCMIVRSPRKPIWARLLSRLRTYPPTFGRYRR